MLKILDSKNYIREYFHLNTIIIHTRIILLFFSVILQGEKQNQPTMPKQKACIPWNKTSKNAQTNARPLIYYLKMTENSLRWQISGETNCTFDPQLFWIKFIF